MLILKRKEIIATALVVMIGVAGYLNWSYQDTIRVTDGEQYSETAKKLGEAQLVNSVSEDVEDDKKDKELTQKETMKIQKETQEYFAQAKLEKENARSKALEILTKTVENENFDEETKKTAQQKILSLASNAEKESIIENVAKAKGYENISVYIDGDSVDIIIDKSDFKETDATILKDIASQQLNIGPSNIKIVQKTK